MNFKLFTLVIGLAVSVNSQNQCGISGSKFVGSDGLAFNGKLAVDGQWPWAAALYQKDGNSRSYYCSGTLIDELHVLTAAHCIQDKGRDKISTDKISVTLGVSDASNNRGEKFDVVEVKMHPEWSTTIGTKYDADLAILKLGRSVRFSKKIQPVCLPSSFEKVFEVTGFIAGYGVTNNDVLDQKLRYLKIPTVTQENCMWHPSGFHTTASKRTFCGGDLSQTACKGDSGAGFVVRSHSSSFKIIGIVSAAILELGENCKSDSYAVFTNVPLFVNWILTETGRGDEIRNEVWNAYNPSTDVIPRNSVYNDEGDARTYVARRMYENNLIIGKFVRSHKTIYLPYFGEELKFSDGIEILASDKRHRWIPFTGFIPGNAVQGGYEGEAKLFVGRRMHEGKFIIGKVVDSIKAIFLPIFWKELRFDDFEILILD